MDKPRKKHRGAPLLLPPPLSFAGCVNIHGEQKFRTPSRPHPASTARGTQAFKQIFSLGNVSLPVLGADLL